MIQSIFEADRLQRLSLIGEDTSDLLRSIEKCFDITFSTDDLVQATTVGKLAECISNRVEFPATDRCLSALVFYDLRRALADFVDVSRFKFHPKTPVGEVLPWSSRRSRWREVQNRSHLLLPDLRWPLWLVGLCLVAAIASSEMIFPRLLHITQHDSVLLVVLGAFLCLVLFLWLMSPLARSFPQGCDTVGDLANLALACNYAKISTQYGKSSEREILTILCHLVAAGTGSDTQKIGAETRFPEDLKIY